MIPTNKVVLITLQACRLSSIFCCSYAATENDYLLKRERAVRVERLFS